MSSYYDDASLMLLASGGAQKDGKVYSVKPTDGSGDFTFTRGSNLSATRVDASQLIEKGRENYVTYSQDFSQWPLAGAATRTLGVTDPNGGTTAATISNIPSGNNSDGIILQSQPMVLAAGNVVCQSIYLKGSGTIAFSMERSLGGSYFFNSSIVTLTSEWQRFNYFAVINSPAAGFSYYVTNRNGTTATSVDVAFAQFEFGTAPTAYIPTNSSAVTAGILENTPRFDYSGGATCPSLLLEPSRTNTIVASEYIAAGVTWSAVNMLTESNAETSPEGVQNATKIIRNAVSGNSAWLAFFNQGSVGNNVVYSAFAKAGTNSQLCITYYDSFTTDMFFNFDLVNGQIASVPTGSAYYVDAGIEDYGNGWYRCYAVVDSQQSTAQYQLSAGGNRGGQINEYIYVYGAMSEIGSYPTSYIPTYGVSQTRAVDVCIDAGDASTFNSTEGVLFAEVSSFAANLGTSKYSPINLTGGSGDFIMFRAQGGSSNRYYFFVYVNNVEKMQFNIVIDDATSVNKFAMRYSASGTSVYINGVKVYTDSVPILFPVNTLTNLRFEQGNDYFKGKVNQTLVFPTALSDLDLAILTGATTYNTFAAMALALNYTVYE
jgi:hypothetical protein